MSRDKLWQARAETHPDRAVVTLSGELDLTAVDQLRDLLTTTLQANPVLDVDLSQLTFLDSTILSVLVTAHHDATAAGGTLNLINPTGHVRKVLTVTGILPLLEPDDTTEASPSRGT
ncbi:STAS domain-containing protein [Micromonospora sp. NPDC006431]|uniref:STAS domain-containing protein n=1 Tax=Micromonospora sp. NPDC006431 TaxID=3364235 RepID=UPI0036D1DBFF